MEYTYVVLVKENY